MIFGGHDEDAACACVQRHSPQPRELNRHHILPKYLGGTDQPENLVWLCPTTHVNTHELLTLMIKYGRLTAHECRTMFDGQPVGELAYTLALRAYDEHTARQAEL